MSVKADSRRQPPTWRRSCSSLPGDCHAGLYLPITRRRDSSLFVWLRSPFFGLNKTEAFFSAARSSSPFFFLCLIENISNNLQFSGLELVSDHTDGRRAGGRTALARIRLVSLV